MYPKQREQVRVHTVDVDALRFGSSRQVKLAAPEGGQRFKRVILALQLNHVRSADGNRVGNGLGNPLLDHHEPVGRPVRQGAQYNGIHHAEDCRTGTDAECQGEHRKNCKPRLVAQHAVGIAKILG